MVPAARRSIGPALSYPIFCGLVLLVATGVAGPPFVSRSALALNAAALLVALVLSTAAHEAAHALVGRAVGFGVISVYLGRGRALWTGKLGPTQLVLQLVPLTGATMVVASSLRWLRTRLLVFYAAGPVSNLLLLAASIPLLPGDDAFEGLATRPEPLLAFAIVNGMLVFFNTIPQPPRTRRGVTTLGSDGWNVLAVPFREDAKLVPLLIAHAAWASPRLVAAGKLAEASALVGEALKRDPGSALARVAHTDLLIATGRWSEAAVRLRLLLDDPAAQRAFPDAMPILANNLAWADFMEDDPALLDEADRCSREALSLAPDLPAAHGTRGAVLLARGDLDAAEERLTHAFGSNTPPNQALNACCLAMVHARRGARVEAEAWLAKARSLSPRCSLLKRAEASLNAPVSASPPAADPA